MFVPVQGLADILDETAGTRSILYLLGMAMIVGRRFR